jgi:predicted DNA-binding ArsR family transcriptional regulator
MVTETWRQNIDKAFGRNGDRNVATKKLAGMVTETWRQKNWQEW